MALKNRDVLNFLSGNYAAYKALPLVVVANEVIRLLEWDGGYAPGFYHGDCSVSPPTWVFVDPDAEFIGGAGAGTRWAETRVITAPEAVAKQLLLAQMPLDPVSVNLIVSGGPGQAFGVDFTVAGQVLGWAGLGLDGLLLAGDVVTIIYNR